MMLMTTLSEKELERRKGVFQDLVRIQILRCQASYGVIGPPVQRITKWVRVDVPKDELRKRIMELIRSGIPPTFEIEDAVEPFGHSTDEWEN